MKPIVRTLLAVGLAFSSLARVPAADLPAEIPLWSGTAPGSDGKTEPENVRVTDAGDHVVTRLHRPTLTPFLPAADRANGTAILVIPGGGHRELCSQDIAEGLAEVYLRFKRVGAPAELHVYGSGGHGFGIRATNARPAGQWLSRFEEWLADRKLAGTR